MKESREKERENREEKDGGADRKARPREKEREDSK